MDLNQLNKILDIYKLDHPILKNIEIKIIPQNYKLI